MNMKFSKIIKLNSAQTDPQHQKQGDLPRSLELDYKISIFVADHFDEDCRRCKFVSLGQEFHLILLSKMFKVGVVVFVHCFQCLYSTITGISIQALANRVWVNHLSFCSLRQFSSIFPAWWPGHWKNKIKTNDYHFRAY